MKIYQFKAKHFKINVCQFCLGNISKNFIVDNMEKLYNGCVFDFSVDYDSINVDNILNIYRYFMKKHKLEYCLGLLKKVYWIIKSW